MHLCPNSIHPTLRDKCPQMFFATQFVLTLGVALKDLVAHLVCRHGRHSFMIFSFLECLQQEPQKDSTIRKYHWDSYYYYFYNYYSDYYRY